MNEKILTSHELEALQEVCNPDFFSKDSDQNDSVNNDIFIFTKVPISKAIKNGCLESTEHGAQAELAMSRGVFKNLGLQMRSHDFILPAELDFYEGALILDLRSNADY